LGVFDKARIRLQPVSVVSDASAAVVPLNSARLELESAAELAE
jgi:hypothetical protein